MKGLELSKLFFEECAIKIKNELPMLYERMAIGLVGEGSECFGFDDEISKDHDYDRGFQIWLIESDYRNFGMQVQGVYAELMKQERETRHSVYGKKRHGVFSIDDFYIQKTGGCKGPENLRDWLFVPEYSLAESVNGQVFFDPLGEFSAVRKKLIKGYPEDVRKKKIAARAAKMAQSGQYNYGRCLAHGEEGAARLALDEFVRHTVQMVYLLNNGYCPYYKWMLRGMESLPILSGLKEGLTALLCAPDTEENCRVKMAMIEQIAVQVIEELKEQGLTTENDSYLEKHAFSVMKTIEDPELKGLHVMAGI